MTCHKAYQRCLSVYVVVLASCVAFGSPSIMFQIPSLPVGQKTIQPLSIIFRGRPIDVNGAENLHRREADATSSSPNLNPRDTHLSHIDSKSNEIIQDHLGPLISGKDINDPDVLETIEHWQKVNDRLIITHLEKAGINPGNEELLPRYQAFDNKIARLFGLESLPETRRGRTVARRAHEVRELEIRRGGLKLPLVDGEAIPISLMRGLKA